MDRVEKLGWAMQLLKDSTKGTCDDGNTCIPNVTRRLEQSNTRASVVLLRVAWESCHSPSEAK